MKPQPSAFGPDVSPTFSAIANQIRNMEVSALTRDDLDDVLKIIVYMRGEVLKLQDEVIKRELDVKAREDAVAKRERDLGTRTKAVAAVLEGRDKFIRAPRRWGL
jgi:hypothetical protein